MEGGNRRGGVCWETANIATDHSDVLLYRSDRWMRRFGNTMPPAQLSHSAEAVRPPPGLEFLPPLGESSSAAASPEAHEACPPPGREFLLPLGESPSEAASLEAHEAASPAAAEAPICEIVLAAFMASPAVSLRVAGIGLATSPLARMPAPMLRYRAHEFNESVARSKSRPKRNRGHQAASPTPMPAHDEEEATEDVVQAGDLLWV